MNGDNPVSDLNPVTHIPDLPSENSPFIFRVILPDDFIHPLDESVLLLIRERRRNKISHLNAVYPLTPQIIPRSSAGFIINLSQPGFMIAGSRSAHS